MRIGINTFLFACPFTDEDVHLFERFAEWGAETVEVVVDDPANIDAAYVRKKLDEAGLTCDCACAVYPPGRDLRGTAEEQEACRQYVEDLFEIMPVLGATVTCGPIYSYVGRTEAYSDEEKERQWATVVNNLRDLCATAEEKGLSIAVEPLNRFETDMINTCEQVMQLIADVGSPALKVHLDTFHMNIEEKDIPGAILRAGDRLGHFHASGSDRGTPGNGHIDWAGVFGALKTTGYDGCVVIESFTQDVEVIARAASIWRTIEPSNEAIAKDGIAFLKRQREAIL